jgi:hypothetical protein
MHENGFDTDEGGEYENVKTLYFTKIDKAKKDENNIKKCFNGQWYDERQGTVLLLKEAKENDFNALRVTGSCNKWKITDQGKVLGSANCNPNNNKWIIVKVITMNKNSKGVLNSFIFYMDDIDSFNRNGVFEEIKCYSIDIIAANTSAVQDMYGMFYHVESALEKDMKKDTSPGLIGLKKLNVENVTTLRWTFSGAIHKQVTLKQLKKWRFSGKNKVDIGCLFSSKVEGLNFRVLDGWSSAKKSKTFYFWQESLSLEQVFVNDKRYKFTPPIWYDSIKNGK